MVGFKTRHWTFTFLFYLEHDSAMLYICTVTDDLRVTLIYINISVCWSLIWRESILQAIFVSMENIVLRPSIRTKLLREWTAQALHISYLWVETSMEFWIAIYLAVLCVFRCIYILFLTYIELMQNYISGLKKNYW